MIRFIQLRGFTFIELLVVMSITVLILTLGLGSYRDFARRQLLVSAARDIRGELRLAQQQAIVGKKPDHPNCNSSDLVGYKIRYIDSLNIQIFAECVDGEVPVSMKQFNTDADISISPFTEFVFNALARGTSTSVDIRLTQVSTGETLDVEIDQNGEIR